MKAVSPFQAGGGPSRGLLRNYTTSLINRFAALVQSDANGGGDEHTESGNGNTGVRTRTLPPVTAQLEGRHQRRCSSSASVQNCRSLILSMSKVEFLLRQGNIFMERHQFGFYTLVIYTVYERSLLNDKQAFEQVVST